jgi:hypothetical protein
MTSRLEALQSVPTTQAPLGWSFKNKQAPPPEPQKPLNYITLLYRHLGHVFDCFDLSPIALVYFFRQKQDLRAS